MEQMNKSLFLSHSAENLGKLQLIDGFIPNVICSLASHLFGQSVLFNPIYPVGLVENETHCRAINTVFSP